MAPIAAAIGVTVVRVMGVGLQALVFVILARSLPISDMGVFAMIYGVLGFVRALGSLGADQVVLRHVAAGGRSAMPPEECVGAAILMTAVSSLCLIALWGAAYALGALPLGRHEVLAIASAIPAFALAGIFTAYLRATGRDLPAQAPESIGQFSTFLILLSSRHFQVDRGTALTFLAISVWTVLVIYSVMFFSLPGCGCRTPAGRILRGVLQEAGAVFVAMCATTLSVRAPVWLAGFVIGRSAAAILDMANRFGSLAGITTASVGVTFSHHFARSQDDGPELGKSLRTASFLAIAPAFSWLIAVVLGARFAVSHMLPTPYAATAYPMALIALAFTINAGFGLSTNLFFMTGRAMTVAWFSLGQLAVICIGAWSLGGYMGVGGIAWAMVFGALVRDGLCMATWTTGKRVAAA